MGCQWSLNAVHTLHTPCMLSCKERYLWMPCIHYILHVCFHPKSVYHIFDFVPANCRFYVDVIERLIRNNLKFRFTASSGELSPDEAVKRNVGFSWSIFLACKRIIITLPDLPVTVAVDYFCIIVCVCVCVCVFPDSRTFMRSCRRFGSRMERPSLIMGKCPTAMVSVNRSSSLWRRWQLFARCDGRLTDCIFAGSWICWLFHCLLALHLNAILKIVDHLFGRFLVAAHQYVGPCLFAPHFQPSCLGYNSSFEQFWDRIEMGRVGLGTT